MLIESSVGAALPLPLTPSNRKCLPTRHTASLITISAAMNGLENGWRGILMPFAGVIILYIIQLIFHNVKNQRLGGAVGYHVSQHCVSSLNVPSYLCVFQCFCLCVRYGCGGVGGCFNFDVCLYGGLCGCLRRRAVAFSLWVSANLKQDRPLTYLWDTSSFCLIAKVETLF